VTFKRYRRTAVAEMADWEPGFDMTGVSVSEPDRAAGSPKPGDKIARNPANHADKWLVAADYFAANFVPLELGTGPERAEYLVRPAVAKFAELMEEQLAKNDHKGPRGWLPEFDERQWYLNKLLEEYQELLRAILDNADPDHIQHEAADLANLAMMGADRARLLAPRSDDRRTPTGRPIPPGTGSDPPDPPPWRHWA
jgi:NTP pyrophosphatase (non-canonical NTP hydrolase)